MKIKSIQIQFPNTPKLDTRSEVAETTRVMQEIGQMGQKLLRHKYIYGKRLVNQYLPYLI